MILSIEELWDMGRAEGFSANMSFLILLYIRGGVLHRVLGFFSSFDGRF